MTALPAKAARPHPKIRSYLDTTEFWNGARQGKLMLQYCTQMGRFQHYPRPVSVFTGRKTLEWREASGNGVVYSWTVTRSAWPGNEERVPYICAYVDLDEDVRFLCNLVDCSENDIYIGPRPVSVFTGRKTLEWREASGKGVVYSWTVTRSAWPGNEERVPYICAYVDLDEDVRFLCNLVDCGENDIYIGMPVEVCWDRLNDEIFYPDFAPCRSVER